MVCIKKYSDAFWAAAILTAVFAIFMGIMVILSHGNRLFLLFLILGIIAFGSNLLIFGCQYFIDGAGITVVRLKLFRKTHPWHSTPTVCVASLWERMSEHGRYILIFLGETPAALQKQQQTTYWFETHTDLVLHFPYSAKPLSQVLYTAAFALISVCFWLSILLFVGVSRYRVRQQKRAQGGEAHDMT